MTKDKAKKTEIRDRMEQTGEPYNVARRALESEDTTTSPAPAAGAHLITDEETRRIADTFLSSSPWHGDVTWDEIVVGPNAEWLCDEDGNFAPSAFLSPDDRWSWRVTFVDPSGEARHLSHELILKGLREVIYGGKENTGLSFLETRRIMQWFTEPAAERRKLVLSSGDCLLICQYALYGRQIFTHDDHASGEKFDLFAEQRTPQGEN
ncbi:hypothetical protein [Nonomuraea bangladeshensis]|uniref:hypothetical protein n=1 Tax=Nonomuraea bangladeshensis TaxID=404385 RepID=UPI003C2C53EB